MLTVARDVPLDLLYPVFFVRFRLAVTTATFMAVPETTMYENELLAPYKHNVGIAWKVFPVKPVAVAIGMKTLSDGDFGSGIFAAYSTHDAAALFVGLDDHVLRMAVF